MEVWKIIFLSKWVIWRFHVNLPGGSHPLNRRELPFKLGSRKNVCWEARSVSASALSITFWRLLVDLPRQVGWLTRHNIDDYLIQGIISRPQWISLRPTNHMHAHLKWNKHGQSRKTNLGPNISYWRVRKSLFVVCFVFWFVRTSSIGDFGHNSYTDIYSMTSAGTISSLGT